MKIYITFCLLCCSYFGFSQNTPVGIFHNHGDVGKPKIAGSSRYDEVTQTYYVKGAGYNIWFNRDEFQYLYQKLKGDFVLTANFEFIGDKGNNHRKYGWMIRESADESAAHVSAVSHGDGLTVMQWRVLRGAYMRDPEDEIFFTKKGFEVVQLERVGKKITMRVAHQGEPLQTVGSYTSEMKDAVLAGLYVCSHDSLAIDEAKIWNVRIDKPVYNASKTEKIQSLPTRLTNVNITNGLCKNLSVSEVNTVTGKVINETKVGVKLQYSSVLSKGNSQIWRMKADGSEKEQVTFDEYQNTAPSISPDGKWLAFISFPNDTENTNQYKQAMVRIIPLTGGIGPKVIAHFYGNQTTSNSLIWSADSKSLNFTNSISN